MVVIASFSEPVEGIILQTPSTKLLVNDQEVGTATLYITENNVIWGGGASCSGGPSPTVTLWYENISMHAIQREPTAALYVILNNDLRLPELTQQSGSGDADEDKESETDDDEPITQLRFIPQNEADLQTMFSAMSQGQMLHPDPADVDDENEQFMDGQDFAEGEEEYEDAEEEELSPADRIRQLCLENSNGSHYLDFEDAEIGDE